MNIRQFLKKIRLQINKLGSKRRNSKLKSKDFSIISNNCFAGIVYQHLGLQYNTPTIGLYFYPDEYIKFCKNFDNYINEELTFIKTENSKYYCDLKKNKYQNAIIGVLKDIEIVFLHYKTEEEARSKWNRRVKRLSKNIIFKFNDQNGCTYNNLKEFNALPYKNKMMFTSKNYPEFNSNIFIKKYLNYNCIKEDYYSCYKYINIIDFINKNVLKKKILHIIPTYNYSGAENVAISIIDYLKDRFDFDYCSFDGNTKEVLKEHGINFICIKKFNPFLIRKIIKTGKYDIIHAHDYKASCICALVKGKKKLIAHLHNNSPWLKKICFNSIAILFAAYKADKILTVSESIEKEYIFSKMIKNKIACIDNPVSREKIISKVNEKNYEKKYDICCVARITEPKNPFRFLDIIKELKKYYANIKVVWVGNGNLEKDVLKKTRKLQLDKNIIFVGFKKNPYKYIASSKIFMLTSDYEGYGIVAFEALTLGLPCVVSNVGGLPKIVDEKSGKLCEKNEDFINEINKLLTNEREYNLKSKNAIKKSKMMDNMDEYMNKIALIYEEGKNEKRYKHSNY